jgi:hypothetical protein
MTKIARFSLLLLAVAALLSAGCGSGAGGGGGLIAIPERWVDEVISRVVAWIEDGTGVEIEKGDVKIKSHGARKDTNTSGHISDFEITVKYRKTEFSSTPKDIPCTTDGIPTNEGNSRIRAAVEEIKRKIKADR